MTEPTKCRSCGAAILFFPTAASNGVSLMPVNAVPDPQGKLLLGKDGRLVVLTVDLFEAPPEGVRYTSHYATCPNAAQHRKPRKK